MIEELEFNTLRITNNLKESMVFSVYRLEEQVASAFKDSMALIIHVAAAA